MRSWLFVIKQSIFTNFVKITTLLSAFLLFTNNSHFSHTFLYWYCPPFFDLVFITEGSRFDSLYSQEKLTKVSLSMTSHFDLSSSLMAPIRSSKIWKSNNTVVSTGLVACLSVCLLLFFSITDRIFSIFSNPTIPSKAP